MDAELRGMMVGMNNLLISLDTNVLEVKDRMTSLENRVTSLEDQMTSLKTEVHGLKDQVTSLETEVHGVKEQVTSLETEVHGVKDQVSSLETEVHGVKDQVSSLELKVTEVRMVLEHDTNRKLDALFDGREDELRYRLMLVNHEEILSNTQARMSNMEVAYTYHLRTYHLS